jgi:hypothetical protein
VCKFLVYILMKFKLWQSETSLIITEFVTSKYIVMIWWHPGKYTCNYNGALYLWAESISTSIDVYILPLYNLCKYFWTNFSLTTFMTSMKYLLHWSMYVHLDNLYSIVLTLELEIKPQWQNICEHTINSQQTFITPISLHIHNTVLCHLFDHDFSLTTFMTSMKYLLHWSILSLRKSNI